MKNIAIPSCGDSEKVFADVYEQFRTLINKYTYYITGSCEDDNDIRQDIFLKLWLHWDQLKYLDDKDLKKYVFMMTRNILENQYRRQVVRRNYKRQAASYCFGVYQDDAIVINEGMEIFHRTLGKLPRRQKEVFQMRNLDNLSINEIAEALKISEHTVRNNFSTAIKKLRVALEKALEIKLAEGGQKKLWSMAA